MRNRKKHRALIIGARRSLALVAALVCGEYDVRGVPVVLESPALSRIFEVPFTRTLRNPRLREVPTDFCQDGTRWRKKTSFELHSPFWSLDSNSRLAFQFSPDQGRFWYQRSKKGVYNVQRSTGV